MDIGCAQCGYENPAEASFCLGCGTRLVAVCPACGRVWPPKARFCSRCGGPLYQLSGERGPIPRRPRLRGLDSPLVGRRHEFRLLRHRLNQLMTGKGQVVAIIGEAGIGKSRLVTEVHRAMSAEPFHWVEGWCLPYGQPVSYGVFVEILHVLLQVGPEAPEPLVRQRLRERLTTLLPEQEAKDFAYLGHLLNLRLNEEQAAHIRFLDERALHLQVFQAVVRFIGASAQEMPRVLVFEDLHWADAASVELLRRLIPLTRSVPLMILWITRPEWESEAWSLLDTAQAEAGDRFTEIWLSLLSTEEGTELARNLLAGDLDDRSGVTRELVLSRAGGNPFFLEEVIRSLLDNDALELEAGRWRVRPGMESQVPETLRGVLVARIDHLAGEDRQVLQRAAVLGRIFSRRLLQRVVDPDVDLEDSLVRLQQEEMIRRRPDHTEQIYVFKHVLMQEAAYDALLLSQRRTIHRRAGEGLEQLYADRLDERFASLARHFCQGQVWDKAFDYAQRAARRAQQTYANDEALAYYGQALEMLARLGHESRWSRKRFELLCQVERIYSRLGRREEQRKLLPRMKSLATQLGDERLPAEVHIREGHYLWRMGAYEASVKVLEEAVETLQTRGDQPRLGRALVNLGAAHWFQNHFREALDHYQEALRIARATEDRLQECRILNNMGIAHNSLQQNEEAMNCYWAGLAIAEQTGNLDFQGALSNNIAHILHDRGEFRRARKGYETALTMSRLVGNRRGETVALANIADLDQHLGNYEASLSGFQRSLDLDISMENEIGQAATQGNISNVLRILGRYGQALELAHQALARHQQFDVQDHIAFDHRHLACIYADLGDYQRAEQHWQACRTLSEALDFKMAAVEACWGLGTVALAQGKPEQALDWLRQAEKLNRATESEWYRTRIHNARAAVYLAMNKLAAANAQARQAVALSDIGPTPHGRLTARGYLAEIALAQRDVPAALQTVQAIWEDVQNLGHCDGSEAELAFVCWKVASAAGENAEADTYLRWGYNILMEQAATLEAHPALRQSFLSNVPAHRALLAAWKGQLGEDDDQGTGSSSAND